MEVFIRTALKLDEVAAIIARAINIAPTNRSPHQREQRRESLSRGGVYYLFEILGIELVLLQNVGEAQIPERSGWGYYAFVDGADADSGLLAGVCEHLATMLRREGLEADVDDLAA